jgi:hypothetical protein
MDKFIIKSTGERRRIILLQRDYLSCAHSEGRLNYAQMLEKSFKLLPVNLFAVFKKKIGVQTNCTLL